MPDERYVIDVLVFHVAHRDRRLLPQENPGGGCPQSHRESHRRSRGEYQL